MKKMLCKKEELPEVVERGDFDVLVVLGAGDVESYMPRFTEILNKKS